MKHKVINLTNLIWLLTLGCCWFYVPFFYTSGIYSLCVLPLVRRSFGSINLQTCAFLLHEFIDPKSHTHLLVEHSNICSTFKVLLRCLGLCCFYCFGCLGLQPINKASCVFSNHTTSDESLVVILSQAASSNIRQLSLVKQDVNSCYLSHLTYDSFPLH